MAPTPEQQRQIKENLQLCFVCCSIVSLGPAIAALVIGLEYEEDSLCNIGGYSIDIKDYLVIAGSVALGWIIMSCTCTVCAFMCCSDLQRARCQSISYIFCACPILIWSFVWAILGLYIYENEMTEICRNQAIGQMIFAWCIINISFVGISFCFVVCLCCAACVAWISS